MGANQLVFAFPEPKRRGGARRGAALAGKRGRRICGKLRTVRGRFTAKRIRCTSRCVRVCDRFALSKWRA